MTQQVNSQDWARNGVYSGHIVDRCDDLETAHEQIIARCYNRKKDGSLGYWKHSSFTHHDFEVMCRLVRDSGYLLTHFLEAVGLTEWADPPKKSDDVAEATHQKALKQAREDLWGDLTSNRPPFANSPGQDHREIGISVSQRMRLLDLPRDAGAVYKKRAGVVSRHHDDTMMRDENRVKKC